MTLALGLVLFGLLIIYAGVKGKSVTSLLLGDNQTSRTTTTGNDFSKPAGAPGKTSGGGGDFGNTSGSKAGGLVEAFYDPLGSYDNGAFGGPIGGHTNHVHLSITNPQLMLLAISAAQKMGLHVGENPYVGTVDPNVHVHDSYHYRNFPGLYNGKTLGMAIDVSGPPGLMATYYRLATTQWTMWKPK